MSDLTEALEAVNTLVDEYGLIYEELVAWLAGPVDGGPESDGHYPITLPNSTVMSVPSPLTLESLYLGEGGAIAHIKKLFIEYGVSAINDPPLKLTQTWNDGLVDGDGGRTNFNMIRVESTVNNTNKYNYGTAFEAAIKSDTLDTFTYYKVVAPQNGVYPLANGYSAVLLSDPQAPSLKNDGGFTFANGTVNITVGYSSANGRPQPVASFNWEDYNSTTGIGETTSVWSAIGTNRLQIMNLQGAIVHRNANGRYEWESDSGHRINFIGYYNADGKPISFGNSGQPQARTPLAIDTITNSTDLMVWSKFIDGSEVGGWTNYGKIDGFGNIYTPNLFIGASLGDIKVSGAAAPAAVTNGDLKLVRNSASVLKLSDGSTGYSDLLAGSVTVNGTLTLNADPSSALQAATKQYVDNLAAGLDVKASVKCATTANITLSGEQTLDGILTSASRVLVKNQTTASQNGIYVSAGGAWTRATDMDSWSEVPGANVWVEEGTTLGDTAWVCIANTGGTLGTTSITWNQFGGTGVYQPYSSNLITYAGIAPSSNVQTLLGSADYTAFRTSLGLVIGTNVQAYSGNLATYSSITPSSNSQSLLAAVDYAAMRTLLSLVPGTNVQAYSSVLAIYAGINPSSNVQTLLGSSDYSSFISSLGLANSATIATGTSGSTIPLLSGTNTWSNAQTFSSDITSRSLTLTGTGNAALITGTGYSLTSADQSSLVDLSGTWNTSGTPTAFKLNITDTTSNAASSLMDLQIATVSQFKVSKAGAVTATGTITAGASSKLLLSGRGGLAAASDGVFNLTNNAGTDFGRIQFGGTTSSFPSLKRNAAAIDARLADDSDYCQINVRKVTMTPAANDSGLSMTGGSVTGSGTSKFFNLTGTWSTSGDVTAIFANITNTSSGANSLLLDLQASSSSMFKVAKDGTGTFASSIVVGASSSISFTGRSKLSSSSDGNILLSNNAGTDFSQLRFGGITSSFPSLKRSTTELHVKLADDSDFANIKAKGLALTNNSGMMQGVPGHYPNATFPTARTFSTAVGSNDLYTVPAGRKAFVQDYWVTNSTGGTIAHYPQLKISGTYYTLGRSQNEAAAGIGHNYGMNGTNSIPIILNAGETYAVNADTIGLTVWVSIVEFDSTSSLYRTELTSWVNGNNTLFTMPANSNVCFGVPAFNASNNPTNATTGLAYFNASGSTVTLSGVWIVPTAGSPSTANQIGGSNSVTNGSIFCKFFPGNLTSGDTIVLNSNSSTTGQFAWINYTKF
jgi:hypothetical protein